MDTTPAIRHPVRLFLTEPANWPLSASWLGYAALIIGRSTRRCK